jgi:hypothetical protein
LEVGVDEWGDRAKPLAAHPYPDSRPEGGRVVLPIPPGGGIPAATSSAAGLMPSLGSSGSATFAFYSAIIDLTTTAGLVAIIPPMPLRLRNVVIGIEIKTSGGTLSVSPTFSLGTDATASDMSASQTSATIITQAAETIVSPTTIAPAPVPNLTTNGYRVNVTAPCTGSSPVLTARFFAIAAFLLI